MLAVALYIEYPGWEHDQMFNLAAPANVNDVLVRWAALQEYLRAHDIELHTHDVYPSKRDVDLWVVVDPAWRHRLLLRQQRLNPRRVVAMLHEPPVVNPWAWQNLKYYRHLIRGGLTWHSGLVQRYRRFHQYHFPLTLRPERYPHYRASRKRNLCLMMHANKWSDVPGELYSRRRQVIRYFERRGDRLLDLYGPGWNDPRVERAFHTDLHAGTTDDKWQTYSEYHFALCIDNCVEPGYITYDPFIAMATGTVPVYLPMPDADQYLPRDTYVNLAEYESLDALVDRLQAIVSSGEYEAYRQRGWAFLNSPRFAPFTVERFCEEMHRGLAALAR